MPEIAEIRDIDGDIWVRVGQIRGFPTGVAIWTPSEAEAAKHSAVNAYAHELEAKVAVIIRHMRESGTWDAATLRRVEENVVPLVRDLLADHTAA